MHYTIYKISNNINGKIYIGSHKTKNLNDNYMGSGKYLARAIAKHGIENFTKEILFVYNNAVEMYAKEAELVNDEYLAEENTYNLKRGGFGGFDFINDNKLYGFANQATAIAGRLTTNKKLEEKYGQEWHAIISAMGATKGSEVIKHKMASDPAFRKAAKDRASVACTHAQSTLAQEKRKQTFKEIGHQLGTKNSQFNKMWITNDIDSKSISKTEIIPMGWRKGRRIPRNQTPGQAS